jgi:hypothetical protein
MQMGMDQIPTIRDLVNLWPTRADLAGEMTTLAASRPVSVHQVHKWAETGSIPAKYHFQLVAAARNRDFPVTADLLIRLHAAEDAA